MKKSITSEEEERYAELQQIALDFAREGETRELLKMLRAGMPANLANEKGQTLLMLASYNGNMETTRMLIEMGADIDRKNDRGQTPLGGVAFKGYVSIAELLIQAGADIHANNGSGMTPIHYASMFGRWDMVTLLEHHGASCEIPDTKTGKSGLIPKLASLVGRIRSLFRKTDS